MSSLSATIQDVFNEPGCGKNANKSEAERKKGCTKQLQPGGAAGGAPSTAPRSRCSRSPMSRISSTAPSPAKAIPGTTAARNRPARISAAPASRPISTRRTSSSAARSGSTRRCREIIEQVRSAGRVRLPDLRPAMIGDDIDAVCKAASEKFGKPVIPVNSPGFVGSKNLGNKLARRSASWNT